MEGGLARKRQKKKSRGGAGARRKGRLLAQPSACWREQLRV